MGELKKRVDESGEEQRRNLAIRCLAGVVLRVIEKKIPSLREAMGDDGFEKMVDSCFPRIDGRHFLMHLNAPLPALRRDEFADVYELLLEQCKHEGPLTEWVAASIACACQGQNHLWQDMGLDDRDMLNSLFGEFFSPLLDRNANNMRWKKFLFRQICEKGGHRCRVPVCSDCVDHAACYGPEV